MVRKWLRVLLLAVALVAASGCTNFFYNRLDTLAAWYVEDLVSLDAAQRDDLRSWLDSTLRWHRQSELLRYAKFLRDLAAGADKPGNANSYKTIERQVEEFGTRLVEQAAPEATKLLLSLTPQQIDEFERNLADKARERNQKDLEALTAGKWHGKRARDIEKQLKRWTGTITKEQQQLIAEESTRFEPTTTAWLESQAHWRAAVFGALRERSAAGESRAAIEERILALLRTPETQWTAAYQSKAANNRAQSLAVLTALDVSLTVSQRDHLRRELIELAQQLEGMATPT